MLLPEPTFNQKNYEDWEGGRLLPGAVDDAGAMQPSSSRGMAATSA
jgi:hypothetical protein